MVETLADLGGSFPCVTALIDFLTSAACVLEKCIKINIESIR